jgi:hypothetical protein
MPRLAICGRRINAATDDFVWSNFFALVPRGFWLAVGVLHLSSSLPFARELAPAVVALSSLALLLDASLACASSRGAPLDPRGRECVPFLLSLRLVAWAAEAALCALCLAVAVPLWGGAAAGLRAAWLVSAALVLWGATGGAGCLACAWVCSWGGHGRGLRAGGGQAAGCGGAPPDDAPPDDAAEARLQRLWEARLRKCAFACPGLPAAAAALRALAGAIAAGGAGGGACAADVEEGGGVGPGGAGASPAPSPVSASLVGPAVAGGPHCVVTAAAVGAGKADGGVLALSAASFASVFEEAAALDLTVSDVCVGLSLVAVEEAGAARGALAVAAPPPPPPLGSADGNRLAAAARYAGFVHAEYGVIGAALDYGACVVPALAAIAAAQCSTDAANGLGRCLRAGGGGGALPEPPAGACQPWGGLAGEARASGHCGDCALGAALPCLDLHTVAARAAVAGAAARRDGWCGGGGGGCCGAPAAVTVLRRARRHARGAATLPWHAYVDWGGNALVLGLRGTIHAEDLLSDALTAGVPLAGLPEGPPLLAYLGLPAPCADAAPLLVHAGFWLASGQVAEEVVGSGLLDRASARGLRLVLVGHSLGAGVAALLALRLAPRFPTLACFAYGAPAAVASPPLAAALSPWVTSVLLGRDIVTGMNLGAFRATLGAAVRALRGASGTSKAALRARSNARLFARALLPWRARVALGLEDGPRSAGAAAGAAAPPAEPHAPPLHHPHHYTFLALPGRVLHLPLRSEGPEDGVSAACARGGGALARSAAALALAPCLPCQDPSTGAAWRARAAAGRAGEVCGDAAAAALWTAACACSWRVRRRYGAVMGEPRERWGGTPLNVDARALLEHLPNCYVAALAEHAAPPPPPPHSAPPAAPVHDERSPLRALAGAAAAF